LSKHEEQLNKRFDDIVSRLDATQRAEAYIRQILSLLVQEVQNLKRDKTNGLF
jgi:hypothetical protein